ncbi:MAG: O-antigen ligase family protein [Verrucomicrobiales bacterium]|nr:O-antigen ligase family protein [Verrucomicrobiales bacterium]
MDVDRLDTWLERAIACLVAAALGFAILAFGAVPVRDAFGGTRDGNFLVVELLVGVSLVLWLVRVWAVRSHRLLWPPVAWGVLLFAGWAAWRTYEAALPYIAWGEFMRIVTYTTLFFVVVNNLHRQDTAQGLFWFLALLATALCFYGAWQFAMNQNTTWGFPRSANYIRRASGSFMSPNNFAGLLELLLPVALSAVIAGRMKALGRIVLAYTVLVMLAGLALTFSRGGWVAAGIGLVFVLVPLARHRDYRWPALTALIILGAAGAVGFTKTALMKQRLETSFDLDPDARNTRLQIWQATYKMWEDHRIHGVGPAHFAERFKQYRTWKAHGEPERAHNDYLNALADWGAAGTAVATIPWLLLAYGVARTLQQVRRDPGDLEVKRSSRYAFVLGATGGLIALLAHSFVDFNFHIPANALVAVCWMGLLTGYSRYATDDWWVSSRRPWRIGITLFILAPLAAALAYDLNRRGRETSELAKADKAPGLSDDRLRHLKAAWDIEDRNAWTAWEIGELYRRRSFAGGPDHLDAAKEALAWFDRAAAVNPFQPSFHSWAGLCLVWLGQPDAAKARFEKAHSLDPEGRITSFFQGWYAFQTGNDAEARRWFVKSAEQGWPQYQPALDYLRLLDQRGAVRPSASAPP